MRRVRKIEPRELSDPCAPVRFVTIRREFANGRGRIDGICE